jgi:hypothetical protein
LRHEALDLGDVLLFVAWELLIRQDRVTVALQLPAQDLPGVSAVATNSAR